MPKALPGAGTLISDSWRLFIKTWNDSLKVSIYFLYIGLAQFALALVRQFLPELTWLAIAVMLALVFVTVWAAIRLIQVALQLEEGKKPTLNKAANAAAMDYILPLIWVAFLEVLVILGGFILLIIPGIYLIVLLSFSQLMLISENKHGSAALEASRQLVRGRWWATLWRIFAGAFVFCLGIAIVTSIIFSLLAVISGPGYFAMTSASAEAPPLVQGTVSLFQSLIQAAVMPLIVIFQIKVFRALQKTR